MTTNSRLFFETTGEPLTAEDHDLQTQDIRALDARQEITETQLSTALETLEDTTLLALIGL